MCEGEALPGGGVGLLSFKELAHFSSFPRSALEVRIMVSVRASVNTGAWLGAINWRRIKLGKGTRKQEELLVKRLNEQMLRWGNQRVVSGTCGVASRAEWLPGVWLSVPQSGLSKKHLHSFFPQIREQLHSLRIVNVHFCTMAGIPGQSERCL